MLDDAPNPYELDEDAQLARIASTARSERRRSLWLWLMQGPKGREVLAEIRDICGAGSFSTNAMQHAYNAGRRSVWEDIEWLLRQTCFPELQAMELEAHDRADGRNDHRKR